MARIGRRTPPQAAPNALVAAATRIRLDQPKIAQRQAARHEEWHDESWAYVDEVPELKFANLFTGGAFAKLGVYAGVRMPGAPENATPVPVDDERSGIDPDLAASAVAEIDRLRSATGGFSQIAGRWVKNMEAVGDCYLVGYGERPAVGSQPARPEDWEIRSVDEIIVKPTSREGAPVYFVRESEQDTEGTPLDPTRDTAIRLYEQHPRWKNRSDCAMRGLLGEARTLQVLSQQVMAQAMRAASAGFLCVPNELSFGAPKPTDPSGGTEAGQDVLNDVLEQVLVGPVQDPANPASVQPGVIRGESKYLHPDFLRRLTLHDPAEDTALEARIEGRIKRLARGVNLPVEVLMGHQQTTFANASQVDEDTFEDFLEPRCRLFVDQLTFGYLRPNLLDAYRDRADQVARIVVWYDPSAVVERPNLEGNATEAHKDFVISDAARRRYQGFTEDDAPDAEEVLIRSALHQTRFGPELVSALLQILADEAGIELPSPAELAQTPATAGGAARSRGLPEVLARVLSLPASSAVQKPTPRPVTASRRSDPGRDLMEIDRELRTRLLVASNDAMNRALERAGNRLRSQAVNHRAVLRDVPAYRVASTLAGAGVLTATSTDEALEGAWDNLHADWLAWAAGAQAAALALSGRLVASMTAADRIALAARQADDLASGWEWFRAQIQQLATDRMFDPDPALPVLGEFDPSLKVPVGLVRQAIARAGGASGLITDEGGGAWVALTDAGTRPAGGIGTGDLIAGVLRDGGVGTEGYVWQYGPAFRQTPFDPHERLDGTEFVNFDDASLTNYGAWPPLPFYMPGDHAGCSCDAAPILIAPASEAAA